jgi:hypothetical protein
MQLDTIYLAIGLALGYAIGRNQVFLKNESEVKEPQSAIEERLRKELEVHKNLNESLKVDLKQVKELLSKAKNQLTQNN